MIIGTKKLYLRYDSSEDLVGVVPGAVRSWWVSQRNNYLVREAPEDLPWESKSFTDKIIKKSLQDEKSHSSDSNEEPMSSPRERKVMRVPTPAREEELFRIAPASVEQISDKRVWQLVRYLGWVDRDEIVRNQTYVTNRMHRKQDRRDLLSGMLRFIEPLKEVFTDISALTELPDEDQMNFFCHVIGKGEDFYKFVLQCPDVSLYLFNRKVQNLFTFLRTSVH